MTASPLRCSIDTAAWSTEKDCVQFTAHDGVGIVMVNITRAGIAALVGKDRSEISAAAAMELFRADVDRIIATVQASYARKPRTVVVIDYSDIEETA